MFFRFAGMKYCTTLTFCKLACVLGFITQYITVATKAMFVRSTVEISFNLSSYFLLFLHDHLDFNFSNFIKSTWNCMSVIWQLIVSWYMHYLRQALVPSCLGRPWVRCRLDLDRFATTNVRNNECGQLRKMFFSKEFLIPISKIQRIREKEYCILLNKFSSASLV